MKKSIRRALRFASTIPLLAAGVAPAWCASSRADPPPDSGQKVFTSYDAPAKELLSKMTLEEKIGQMIQPDQSFLKDPSDIERYFLGSTLRTKVVPCSAAAAPARKTRRTTTSKAGPTWWMATSSTP